VITASGASVWQTDSGRPEGVPTPEDIGQALGRIPRFAGQTKLWYPVLAHILTVAALMPEQYAVFGLLHDAPEAITSDVPTPWKAKEQRELEHLLYERMVREAGFAWPIPEHIQNEVDKADYTALIAEAYLLGHAAPHLCVRRSDTDKMELEDIHDAVVDPEATRLTQIHLEKATTVFVDPQDHSSATLAFLEPEISGRVYREAYEFYAEKFDPTPLS
jgi:hypothetical protein